MRLHHRGIVHLRRRGVRHQFPSRSTAMRSANCRTSCMRCETYSSATPESRSRRSTSNSRAVSVSVSDEVGSSSASNRTPVRKARTISSSCRCAGPNEPARVQGEISCSSPNGASASRVRSAMVGAVEKNSRAARKIAGKKILGYREVAKNVRLLMHHANAGCMRVGRAAERYFAPVQQQRAGEQVAAHLQICAAAWTCPPRSRPPAPAPRPRARAR